MKWVKVVLIFQAIITLILGLVFFSQVMAFATDKISDEGIQDGETQNITGITEIKQRFSAAAYILLFVSSLELIIVIRLFS